MGAETETGVMQKLQVALNHYLRVLAGAPDSTPITLLQSHTGIPPVEIIMERTIVCNLARAMSNPECMLERTYEEWNGEGWNTTPLGAYRKIRNALNPPDNSEIGGKERISHEAMSQYQHINFEVLPSIKIAVHKHKRHQLIPKYDIYLWTDGSLTRQDGITKASAGWYYTKGDLKASGNTVVQPALSSYHAESVAMAKGIEQLLKDKDFITSKATVGIFTDSHGLCDHLMKLKRQDVPVEVHTQNLIEQLIKLKETNPERVTIHWIPSHRGIGDNERADEQAEEGHKSKEVAVIPYTRRWLKTNLMGKPMLHFYEHLKDNLQPSELV